MPRFSVIVPAHKVQAYLHECLDSVLAQSFRDFELIAVDDSSPDSCGEIIDAAAAADPRVTAVHLEQNVGLGRARNAGLRRASGEYIVFLDGDDTLTPGALQAIENRLAATSEPDVLLYDFARTYWSGRVERNDRSVLLSQDGPAVFTLEDRPGLMMLLSVVWNKAYRREFIERTGLEFPAGYYEDAPWSYPALMAAGSIAALDRVCVHYRQRRQGNILRTTSRKHFDVFDQYERIFAFIDEREELAHWRPLVHRRMVDHLTTVYNTPGRLPRSTRAEFFRRSRDHARRFLPAAGTPAPRAHVPYGRRTKLRHDLVRHGARRAFDGLWAADRLRGRARGQARTLYKNARKAALRVHYKVQQRLPVDDNLAVFAAYWNKGYACNPAAIEAKVRELAPHIRTAWITTPEYADTLPEGVQRLHPGSKEFWKALARGKYFVNNVNFPAQWAKRPGQVHVQTHHGTPLKRMGLDQQDYPASAAGMNFGRLLRAVDRWDFSLSANRHTTLAWERAYPASYTTLEYGYPRNDVLFTATAEDVARIRADLGIPEGATAVLYTPTHRDYQSGYVPRLDLDRVTRTLGPGYVILARPHYFYREAETGALSDAVIDVSQHPSIEELCLAADALVTDYSSIMFDYADLDRPIVLHADDWETYRAARGTYFDLMETPPGPVARSEDELIDLFSTGAWHGTHAQQLRQRFRDRFCDFDDGYAAERVVRRVFLGEDPAPPLPREARKPAPAPAEATPTAVPRVRDGKGKDDHPEPGVTHRA
ncbi:bifunctional glycosyltransferase family 2 protein/CDP-glycerol:glycerophosphate glycerophosphotransferase [Streptomyces sp. ODS28]|uniref:bifunctional glycosyltransferase/CDP-glycerol:glycerophosphate glycerophosphotransferase n=1 Tax=Streptomyces sp. ODS28 TaxID=3136688 RepID=UPI0031EA7C8D